MLTARGEFSIVIASLGAVVEPELSALAGTYVLITVLTGPILTRLAGTKQNVLITEGVPTEPVPAAKAVRAA